MNTHPRACPPSARLPGASPSLLAPVCDNSRKDNDMDDQAYTIAMRPDQARALAAGILDAAEQAETNQ